MSNNDAKKHFSGDRNDILKLIAVFCMIMDHAGLLLYPHLLFFRIMGRLALPIFAYYLVQGYIHTSNLKKYAVRILIFAIVSQPLYALFVKEFNLNIMFLLFSGLMALHSYKNKHYLVLIAILAISYFIHIDYSLYGILTILGFYAFKDKQKIFLAQSIINILGVFLIGAIQPFALLGTSMILHYPDSFPKIRLHKYFFYIFYPSHLAILYTISKLPFFAR